MEEIWKRVVLKGIEYPREVSNTGRCRKITGEECALADNGAGYLSAGISTYKSAKGRWQPKREYIHRLVATAFLPNPDNLPQVNHKDCDKSNNHVYNLEWVTGRQNILDAHAKGRMLKRTSNGEISVLTEEQVIDLYTAVKIDNIGISKKAKEMNIPRTTASSVINKRSRRNITDLLDEEFLK